MIVRTDPTTPAKNIQANRRSFTSPASIYDIIRQKKKPDDEIRLGSAAVSLPADQQAVDEAVCDLGIIFGFGPAKIRMDLIAKVSE
jgi:hypothetical protein